MYKPLSNAPQAHWIWSYTGAAVEPECVLFQKTVRYTAVPETLRLHITADTAYIVRINGQIVCRGPAKSQTMRYYDTVDIAPYLQNGENTLTAQVIHYVGDPHRANRFEAGPVSMPAKPQGGFLVFGDPAWQTDDSYRCCTMKSYGFIPVDETYMYLGYTEEVDARVLPEGWAPAVKVEAHDEYFWGGAARIWQVRERPIPLPFEKHQTYAGIARASENFPDAAALLTQTGCVIPPHTEVWAEIDAGANLTAFPLYAFSGGKDSRVEMRYAECYGRYGEDGTFVKDDRTDCHSEGQCLDGLTDVYIAGEGEQRYQPFFYKAFRYIHLHIRTGDAPLGVRLPGLLRTGYPMEVTTTFDDLSSLDREIWEVSLRTLQNCMYDTYMDCPHYERMQYVMDTFLQILYSAVVTCDDRLARKAITDIGDGQRAIDGLIPCCIPSNFQQIIPGFGFFFVFMLKHYYEYFGKRDLLRKYYPVVERVLWFFEEHLTEDYMLANTGYWQFVDWVEQWNRGVPIRNEQEPNGVYTMMYAFALKEAAVIADELGYPDMATRYRGLLETIRQAADRLLYDPEQGFYRDTPGRPDVSQHTQIWAVLSGIADESRAGDIMRRCLTDPHVAKVSFCMQYYLFRALEHVDNYAATRECWSVWKDLLAQHVTTWPEDPVTCRSECHAWSAVPLHEYPRYALGVRQAEAGFRKVYISPKMLWLGKCSGRTKTPAGTVAVAWELKEKEFAIQITTDRPMHIVWQLPGYTGEETVNGTVHKQVPLKGINPLSV